MASHYVKLNAGAEMPLSGTLGVCGRLIAGYGKMTRIRYIYLYQETQKSHERILKNLCVDYLK